MTTGVALVSAVECYLSSLRSIFPSLPCAHERLDSATVRRPGLWLTKGVFLVSAAGCHQSPLCSIFPSLPFAPECPDCSFKGGGCLEVIILLTLHLKPLVLGEELRISNYIRSIPLVCGHHRYNFKLTHTNTWHNSPSLYKFVIPSITTKRQLLYIKVNPYNVSSKSLKAISNNQLQSIPTEWISVTFVTMDQLQEMLEKMQRKATEDMREAVNEAHSKANSELKETVKEAQVQSTVQFQKLFTGQTQLRGQMAGIEARFVDYNGEVDERLKMMNEGIPDLVKSHCIAETQLQMEQDEGRILAAAISNTEETVEEVRQSLPALVEPLEKRLANQGELITTNTVVNANCAKEMKHMKDRQAKFEKQLADLSQPVALATEASVLANNNPSTVHVLQSHKLLVTPEQANRSKEGSFHLNQDQATPGIVTDQTYLP